MRTTLQIQSLFALWLWLLICWVDPGRAFPPFSSSWVNTRDRGVAFDLFSKKAARLAFLHRRMMELEDDDDISQHMLMVANATTTTTMTNHNNEEGAKGYRPIEAWHQENRNPTHVLDHLKREQAHWKGKFEDLGGDGI